MRFVGGIIQGRLVSPEILGYYSKFTILPGYLMFLEFGVFVALSRQYPYYMGKGDTERAIRYASNALGWARILCVAQAAMFAAACLWAMSRADWPAALGWGSQIVLTIASTYMLYLGSTYRNSSEFVYWSKASLISSALSLVFLPVLMAYRFFGVCVRNSLPNFFSMLYAHWKRPLRIRPQLNVPTLKEMIVFGAPLMVFGYILTSCWDATLRVYILKTIDEKALGVFALAGGLCTGLTTVASSISQVFHPRIAALYGSSGENKARTFNYCVKCSLAGFAVMLPLVLLVLWLVDPLVRLLLPMYIDCVPIVRYLAWLSLVPVLDLPYIMIVMAKGTGQYGTSVMVGFLSMLLLLGALSISKGKVTLQEIVLVSVGCKFLSTFLADGFAWYMARGK